MQACLPSCSATNLRPLDARMWCAMGQCYENEQLAMDTAAIRCYRRALVNQDREGIAVHKLVRVRDDGGTCMQTCLQR